MKKTNGGPTISELLDIKSKPKTMTELVDQAFGEVSGWEQSNVVAMKCMAYLMADIADTLRRLEDLHKVAGDSKLL